MKTAEKKKSWKNTRRISLPWHPWLRISAVGEGCRSKNGGRGDKTGGGTGVLSHRSTGSSIFAISNCSCKISRTLSLTRHASTPRVSTLLRLVPEIEERAPVRRHPGRSLDPPPPPLLSLSFSRSTSRWNYHDGTTTMESASTCPLMYSPASDRGGRGRRASGVALSIGCFDSHVETFEPVERAPSSWFV